MFARVATFEGGSAEAMRAAAAQIGESDGPPPGLPAKGVTMLFDPESGKNLTIVFFETDEDYRTGDAALEQMDPNPDAGRRTEVARYEVAVERRM